jgi:Leucine-rich repeat (LRR) protein
MGLDLTFGRSLKALPEAFSNLKNLIYLHLGNCEGLKQLPKSIGQLKKLENLHLEKCQGLKKLPDSIGELKNLENLHLGFCSFTGLPLSLGELKMLVILDLGNCANLTELPHSIGKLKRLVTLNLFQCSALKYLPSGFHFLTRLESLNVLGCGNLSVPAWYIPPWFKPDNAETLENLRNLKTNKEDICRYFKMPHLTSLVIHKCSRFSGYRLEELEDFTLHTSEIEVFHSQNNSFLILKTLRLSSLPNLHSLDLDDCPNLVNLTLNDCPNLEDVALTNCPNLLCLPSLDSLPNLGLLVLKLSIEKLPQSFTHRGAFLALNFFNLSQSKLVEFPEVEEGAMPKLQWLDFHDCIFLHILPASLSLLTSIH